MQPSTGTVKGIIPLSFSVIIVVKGMKATIKIWLIMIEPVRMKTRREMML
jgi:hypothetical protein